MKTILTLTATLFITAISNAQEFKFEKELINYGKVLKGTNKTKIFEFTNVGNAPLVIKQVISTCGCAVPKKPENPIMPGAKGKIEVSYDTNRIGGFSKMFTVISNAKNKRKQLKIKGFVKGNNVVTSK